MSVLGEGFAPWVCDGDHGQPLLPASDAPPVNAVVSPLPVGSDASGCPPTVSQSWIPVVFRQRLPSISNPDTTVAFALCGSAQATATAAATESGCDLPLGCGRG